jgi:two-component system, chemotaxis family, sensor histidine kinase and response regulator PixL
MDKELEIKRQFLDEAQEYLDDLDTAFLGMADQKIDPSKINAALRAAHSIKGGAGMMQFTVLSDLAHRIEDSLKVLKIQRDNPFDGSLETLALNAVNSMRQVVNRDRLSLLQSASESMDSPWLNDSVMPLFDQLRDRLGAPQDDDAASMLSSDEGQDIIPMIFETEVEGCLQRLEAVLADPQQPCLREEVTILAQELGGLGEMLQLGEFRQLCESVLSVASTCSEDLVCASAIAALDAWRTTQAMVLGGQFTHLPTSLEGFELGEFEIGAEAQIVPQPSILGEQEVIVGFQDFGFADDEEDAFSWDDAIAAAEAELVTSPDLEMGAEGFASSIPDVIPDVGFSPVVNVVNSVANSAANSVVNPVSNIIEVTPDRGSRSESNSQPNLADDDATVRVSVRQLNQLNDLFGELAIERNGLDLYFKRLNGLMRLLGDRVKQLDQTNIEVRNLYDRSSKSQTQDQPNSRPRETRVITGVDPFNAVPTSDVKIPSTGLRLGSYVDPRSIEAQQPESNGETSEQAIEMATLKAGFDDLELDRYSELHSLSQQIMEAVVQIQEVTSDLNLSIDDASQTTRNLNKTAKQLQTRLTQLRMRPLADVTDRFPRALRDLSLQYGKRVKLQVTGGNLLVDRNILEALQDPLMHLLRNAFDHGIEAPDARRAIGKAEEGTIQIKAIHRGNRTEILIQDDGNGIPLHKIRQRAEQMGLDAGLLASASEADLLSLIFEPGFSTSDSVTKLSGRGVGMDIVRDNLKQIRGDISVSTQPGLGTTFKLSLPYTLSIVRILLAESQGMLLGLPNDTIDAVQLFDPEMLHVINGREYITHQNESIPLLRLGSWLHFNCVRQPQNLETPASLNAPTLLFTQRGDEKEALLVDRCWGEQEVALRRIEAPLALPTGFSGCTILGDGRVVPLVNVNELLHLMSTYTAGAELQSIPESNFNLPKRGTSKSTILIVDDSINVRRFLALTLERAGYRVEQAKDGQDAMEKLESGLQVSAIICDVEMPRLDGFGVLNRLRSIPHLKHIPIAMLTSRSGEKHRRLANSLGASAYFTKPYSEQDLLTTLNQMVNLIPV